MMREALDERRPNLPRMGRGVKEIGFVGGESSAQERVHDDPEKNGAG
jgi:hypothetical protein